MSILSSELIQHFLSAVAKNAIPTSKSHLEADLAQEVLARFQSEAAFLTKCNHYHGTQGLSGLSDFFLLGSFGVNFYEKNKEIIINFLHSIKSFGDTDSVLEYIMGDIASVSPQPVSIDDLARALYAPIHINPEELNPEDPADAAYIALVRWVTRTCIVWVFHAFEEYSEIREDLKAAELEELQKDIPF